VLATAILLLSAGRAAAQPPSQPAPPFSPVGPAPPLPRAQTVDQGLQLTEEELQALAPASQKIDQIEEPGLYVILRRAAAMPELTEAEREMLDQPSYVNLRDHPEVYRLRAMRIRLRVNRVFEAVAGTGLSQYSHWWPRGKPAWIIDGLAVSGGDPYRQDQPLRVVSVVAPDNLPKPDKVQQDGAKVFFEPGPAVEVAGVFYKVYRRRSIEGPPRDYPVIVAWQIAPRGGRAEAFDSLSRPVGLILVIVALAAGFVFFKRRARRAGEAARPPDRRPGAADGRQPHTAQGDQQAGQVDPLLTAAVEEYRKQGQQ
jgi:hypothetical protein